MKIKSFIFPIMLAILLFFIYISFFSKETTKSILLDKENILTYTSKEELSGNFIFSLRTSYIRTHTTSDLMKSYLISMSDKGILNFLNSSYSNWSEKFFYWNFGILDKDLYSYFAGTYDDPINNRGSLHLMDRNFRQVLSSVLPSNEAELDGVDVVKSPDGNMFYLYERKSISGDTINHQIYEKDKNGNTIFIWDLKKAFSENPEDVKLFDNNIPQINSIFLDENKNIIVSLLGINEVLKIEYMTGRILWRIRSSDWLFKNDTYGGFIRQHCVRMLSNGNILMLDNGPQSDRPTRAVEYKIDPSKKVIEQVWEYKLQGDRAIREGEGSVQRLSNGNTLIGWGRPANPSSKITNDTIFTEVSPSGEIIKELKTNTGLIAYRVYFEEKL